MVKLKVQYKQQNIFDGQASSFQDVQRAIETQYPEFQEGAHYIYHKDPFTNFQELVYLMKKLNISSIKVKAYPTKLKDQIMDEQNQKIKLQKQKVQLQGRKIKKIMENQYQVSHQNQHRQGNPKNGSTVIQRYNQSSIYVEQPSSVDKVPKFKQSRINFYEEDNEDNSIVQKPKSPQPNISENNYHSGCISAQQYDSLKSQLQRFIIEMSQSQQQKQTQQTGIKQNELRLIIKQSVKQQIKNFKNELKNQVKMEIENKINENLQKRQFEHRQRYTGQLNLIKQQINILKQQRPIATNNYQSISTDQTYKYIKAKISQEIARQINKIKYDLEKNNNYNTNKLDYTIEAKLKQDIKTQIINQMDSKNRYIDQNYMTNLVKSQIQTQNKQQFDSFSKDIEQKVTKKLQSYKIKFLKKINDQVVDEYNVNYAKAKSYIDNQQYPREIKQGENENKTVEPTINHKTMQDQNMTDNNPLINYRQQFEGFSTKNLQQQQKESPYKQNNKHFKISQKKTEKPTPFQNQSSNFFSSMQHPQIKTQNNNNIKGGIMDNSSMKKKQSPQKTKKSQQKNTKAYTKPLTLQQKRGQYSYKLVDTVQYVTLKPKDNYIWTINLSNNGTDWEDFMIIIDKTNNRFYNVGPLKGDNPKRVQLGPLLHFKKGINERQFVIGYKTVERYRQTFHQIGDKFKLTVNVIEPEVTKQRQFEERINYLIRVYIKIKNIKPKPMQQILEGFYQVGITQETYTGFNQEALVDLLLELHGFTK